MTNQFSELLKLRVAVLIVTATVDLGPVPMTSTVTTCLPTHSVGLWFDCSDFHTNTYVFVVVCLVAALFKSFHFTYVRCFYIFMYICIYIYATAFLRVGRVQVVYI